MDWTVCHIWAIKTVGGFCKFEDMYPNSSANCFTSLDLRIEIAVITHVVHVLSWVPDHALVILLTI